MCACLKIIALTIKPDIDVKGMLMEASGGGGGGGCENSLRENSLLRLSTC